MHAKSDSTTAFSGNGCPRFGAKGPYETPRAKNLRSPSEKNMPDVRMRSTAAAAPSSRRVRNPNALGGFRDGRIAKDLLQSASADGSLNLYPAPRIWKTGSSASATQDFPDRSRILLFPPKGGSDLRHETSRP